MAWTAFAAKQNRRNPSGADWKELACLTGVDKETDGRTPREELDFESGELFNNDIFS
jgi:hypothetical protein